MTKSKTTPSEPIGQSPIKWPHIGNPIHMKGIAKQEIKERIVHELFDGLVDRDCVILDGHCDCKKPFEDCKYLKEK